MLRKLFDLSQGSCVQDGCNYEDVSDIQFLGVDGATSLKAEIVGRVPKICDASKFREARLLLNQLGGPLALREELTFAGFVDPLSDNLTVNEKPFNVFAQFAAGRLKQHMMDEEQLALGEYRSKFLICANRPDNDLHWDSHDPKWIPKASMARRHRFLTTKDLHWQWFNMLVVGTVPPTEGGADPRMALAEVEQMKAAALRYATQVGGWSDQVGLYVNIFGHNNVNSLFIHIIDMSELGPGFTFQNYKNCPLDAVIKVLREESASKMVTSSLSQRTLPSLKAQSSMSVRRKSISEGNRVPFFFAGTDGATSLKAELVGRVPVMKAAANYREGRRLMTEELGGAKVLKEELIRFGFVDSSTGLLTTGTTPFNVFARVAAGKTEQPGMAEEQQHLGEYQKSYMICANRPECDEHWDSEDAEWAGRASMSRRHRFLTTKDLHWQWFNALTFGLVPESEGGVDTKAALAKVEEMKQAALQYAANSGWSPKVGLFFHVFGHNSVNSLHMHILDMEELGPNFWKCEFKNAPVDTVIKVLKEEVAAMTSMSEPVRSAQSLLEATEAAARAVADATEAATKMMSLTDNKSMSMKQSSAEVLTINVGGELVTVARETLLLAPEDTLFSDMFQTGWERRIERDDQGRMFLDFPPTAFKAIVNHLRLLHLTPPNHALPPLAAPKQLKAEVQDLAWLLGVDDFLFRPIRGRGPEMPDLRPRRRFWGLCGRRRPPPLPPPKDPRRLTDSADA